MQISVKLVSLLGVFVAAVTLGSCRREQPQETRYLMNFNVMQMGKDISQSQELKDQQVVICFADISSKQLCSKNMLSGGMIDLRTASPFVKLVSIKLLGKPEHTYAFSSGSEPTATLKQYTPNTFMGKLLIFIEQENGKAHPNVTLFSACKEKTKDKAIASLVKLKMLDPKIEVATDCMEIGTVIDSYVSPHGGVVQTPNDAISLFQLIPHVRTD